jgi:hypothetical protein
MRVQDKIRSRRIATRGEEVLPIPHHSGYAQVAQVAKV